MKRSGLFVTGTDTGVGKTLVACALLRIFRAQGRDAAGFKPVATGMEDGRWLDAVALAEAGDGVEPPERVCPLRFQAPMAPVQAAKLEGCVPDLRIARKAFKDLAARHEVLVAEGVGGLLVPLDEQTLLVDFIRWTGLPAVVVCKAQLGTVNHTLLTLRELARQRIAVAAVIMNTTSPQDAANARPSAEEIERHGVGVRAILPYMAAPCSARAADELAACFEPAGLLNEGWQSSAEKVE